MLRRPNIILITSAQHRWDCARYAGNPDVKTPNLDLLARHGLSFSEAICQSPMAIPSRTTLMTGRYPARHGIRDGRRGLPLEATTLPGVLFDIGYHTAAVGQMQFTPPRANYGFHTMKLAEREGADRNDDDYHTWLESQGVVDQIGHWDSMNRDAAPQEYWDRFSAMPSTLSAERHSTTWIGNQAVRFLQNARRPFFLWVSFMKPHAPFDPPRPWDRMYNPAALTLPNGFRSPPPESDLKEGGPFDLRKLSEAAFRRVLAFYYASISHLDSQIGRILATVSARGHTNNVVVYTSDHGDYMGEHGLIRNGGAPYDALIRVPLVISGLAGMRMGEVDPAHAELTDIMPTLLESAGVPVPTTVQGKSLLAQTRRAGVDLRSAAFCEYIHETKIARSRRFKLVESTEESYRGFFNIGEDPNEFDNLMGQPRTVNEQVKLTKIIRQAR